PDLVGAVAQAELEERRERGLVERGELTADAAGGADQVEVLAEEVLARRVQHHQRAAFEHGLAGDVDAVGLAAGRELGDVGRTRRLGVIALHGQGADGIARRHRAFDAHVADDAAAAAEAGAGVHRQLRSGQRAVDHQGAAVDLRGVGVVAGQFQHAFLDVQPAEGVVAAQAQPADAGLGQHAGAADVVAPVVPGLAFPH
ncbi:hypothetical protein CATMIT_01649, partial [Catenibacterium mitsuokai DSM 15897]